jgi:hypothetical protein
MVGLEAHFPHVSQLSGCRSGCSLYFPLGPEEQIAYCWLRVVNYDRGSYGLTLAVSFEVHPSFAAANLFPRFKRHLKDFTPLGRHSWSRKSNMTGFY